MSQSQGPTVRRRIVASELRRLRLIAAMKQQDVAAAVDIDPSALSRYEQAKSSMTVHVAARLFDLYGVEDAQRDALLDLVKGSRRRGWLKGYTGVVPEWFEGLVALERDASAIHEFAIHVLPGLVQTEEYARAVLRAGARADRVEEHLALRLKRTELLNDETAPEYWVIICESAMRCLVGGTETLRGQLEHLLVLSQRPNVTIQVLPSSYGAHRSMTNPFSILRFALAPHYRVAYLDYLTGSLYMDDPGEVEQYDGAFKHLIKASLSETESRTLIKTIAKEV
ncbi:helix-turn-helix protein [Stackebrandtia albiflava]|uniref:Helix-turn-helix protein n=1 Tax=Stackebrandtia albiflava TaxID=406432 RepID=A0A562ULF8_9ACTN|nr:helix-turn-helix transcriptional regulator [Stackebrandtia albiflava]TWJ06453.1 helix-turn-helix protein [Stackebrandtia albiflava]